MSENHHQPQGNQRQLNPNADNFVPRQQQNASVPLQLLTWPVQHPHGHQFPMQQVPFPNPPGNQFPRQQGNNHMQYLHQNLGDQNALQNQLDRPTVSMHQVVTGRHPQLNPPDNQFLPQQRYNPMLFTQQNVGHPNRLHRSPLFQGHCVPQIKPYPDILGPYQPHLQPRVPYPPPVIHGNQPIWMNRPPQRMFANQARFKSEFLGPNHHRGNSSKGSRPSLPWRKRRQMGGLTMQRFKKQQERSETKSAKDIDILKLCKKYALRSFTKKFSPTVSGFVKPGKINYNMYLTFVMYAYSFILLNQYFLTF